MEKPVYGGGILHRNMYYGTKITWIWFSLGPSFLIYSCNWRCSYGNDLPAAIKIEFLCHTLPLTPGQASGLQLLVSMFPPIEEQSEPPLRGTGLVQFLVLTWVPPPQVTGQEDHWVHSSYPPATEKGEEYNMWASNLQNLVLLLHHLSAFLRLVL